MTSPKVQVLRAPNLTRLPWLLHGFSTRLGGFSSGYGGDALNLGFTKEDTRTAVERNRAAFVEALANGHPRTAELRAARQPGAAVPLIRERGMVVGPDPHQPKASCGAPPISGAPSRNCEVSAQEASAQRWSLVGLRQIHSDIIHHVRELPAEPLAGDGLVTATPGLLLTIKTADCIPVLIVDPKRRAVGAFHAGWRGTVKRIVEKGVGEMRRHFGSRPADLLAAIGPGIHRCCYQVGEEVRDEFASQFDYASALFEEHRADSDVVHERYPLLFLTARAPGHSELPHKILLDLVEANRRQLIAAGIPESHITASEHCTACRTDLFFSFRKEGPTGRMMNVVRISDC